MNNEHDRLVTLLLSHGHVEWDEVDARALAETLRAAGFGDVSAERERADKAEADARTGYSLYRMEQRRANDLDSENDALQARIDAALKALNEPLDQTRFFGNRAGHQLLQERRVNRARAALVSEEPAPEHRAICSIRGCGKDAVYQMDGGGLGMIPLCAKHEPYQCSQEPHKGREFYGDGACAECGYKPPKPDPRVTFTLELLSILDSTASEEDSPLEWVEGYLEHLVDQFVPGAMEAWEKRGGIDPDMAESEAAL